MRNCFVLLLALLLAMPGGEACGASAVIFSGSTVKALKDTIDINGKARVLTGTANPTSSATDATIGSVYLNSSTGQMYRKTDAGSSTNWLPMLEARRAGDVINLGFTYSAGTFTVASADGSALSTSNPGYVFLQDRSNPGRLKRYIVTANQAFIDDVGASEIINNLFGTTTGVAWASDLPAFVTAVGNDNQDAIAFMLTRDPRATVSPAEALIGAPDDPVADTEPSFFSFDSLDETVYDANPCATIGAVRMTKTAADDWTISALSTKDGIGKFHESTKFTFAQNQNGAASGTNFLANGGTPAQYTTETYNYWLRRDGRVDIQLDYDTDGGTDGSGAVNALMALPIDARASVANSELGHGYIYASGIAVGHNSYFYVSANTMVPLTPSASGYVTHSLIGNGSREIHARLGYQGFTD